MSTSAKQEQGFRRGKGDAAEAAAASRAWRLGRRRKSCGLSHCVEHYHSEFWTKMSFSVNVGFAQHPRFFVFTIH